VELLVEELVGVAASIDGLSDENRLYHGNGFLLSVLATWT